MPQPENFACTACGKKYKWKPELAGKRVRCGCGSAITVPIPAAAVAKDDDIYDMAGPSDFDMGPGIELPPSAPRAVMPVAAKPSRNAEIADQRSSDNDVEARRFSFLNLNDPVRDLYVPTAMLVTAFIGAIVWAMTQNFTGPANPGVVVVSFYAALGTLIKTAVVTSLAILFSSMLELSFGLLQTAILKIAASLIFSDAVLLWVIATLKSAGGISQSGRTDWHFIFVDWGCRTTVIAFSVFYLFQFDWEETAKAALPMAAVSWVVDWILDIVIGMILAALVAARTQAMAAVTAAVASTPAPASSVVSSGSFTPANAPAAPVPIDNTPVTVIPTPADRLITSLTTTFNGEESFMMRDGRSWIHTSGLTDGPTRGVLDAMYAAGATKITIEMMIAPRGTEGKPFWPKKLFVELPTTKGARDACMQAFRNYRISRGLSPQPTTGPALQQYLIVDLKH